MKKKTAFSAEWKERVIPVRQISSAYSTEDFEEKTLRSRAAYFVLNGTPTFAVNELSDGKYKLLAAEKDFCAAVASGVTEVTARVYKFSEKNAEISNLEYVIQEKYSEISNLQEELATKEQENIILQEKLVNIVNEAN